MSADVVQIDELDTQHPLIAANIAARHVLSQLRDLWQCHTQDEDDRRETVWRVLQSIDADASRLLDQLNRDDSMAAIHFRRARLECSINIRRLDRRHYRSVHEAVVGWAEKCAVALKMSVNRHRRAGESTDPAMLVEPLTESESHVIAHAYDGEGSLFDRIEGDLNLNYDEFEDFLGKEYDIARFGEEWDRDVVQERCIADDDESHNDQSERVRTSKQKPNLKNWALALDGESWRVFQFFPNHKAWRDRGVASVPAGTVDTLAKELAKTGGVIEKHEAIKLFGEQRIGWPPNRLFNSCAKPARKKLATVIQDEIGRIAGSAVTDNPLPWKTDRWMAKIRFGYAVKDDAGNLRFRPKDTLDREEQADLRPPSRVASYDGDSFG